MRIVLALAACLGLAGCFMSEQALYAENDGNCLVPRETEFTVPTVDVNNQMARAPAFTLAPDGRYCTHTQVTAQQQTVSRILFVPLEQGWYIAQRVTADNPGGFIYQLARFEGNRLEFYMPGCADFTAAALEAYGIAAMDMGSAMSEPPAEAPPETRIPIRPPRTHAKQAGPAPNMPTLICTVTERSQLEAAFRAWRRLGRPASEFGERAS